MPLAGNTGNAGNRLRARGSLNPAWIVFLLVATRPSFLFLAIMAIRPKLLAVY
jgi:hypothetical protein